MSMSAKRRIEFEFIRLPILSSEVAKGIPLSTSLTTILNSSARYPWALFDIRFMAVGGLSPAPTESVSISTTAGNSDSTIALRRAHLALKLRSLRMITTNIEMIDNKSAVSREISPNIDAKIRKSTPGSENINCTILKFS
jgi:hypothetical protein